MCTVLLPPCVNPAAVNKYSKYQMLSAETCEFLYDGHASKHLREYNLYALELLFACSGAI